jgi:predicted mannosyl-3-phosphoglycerate phosphatase (HAD superfamily)
MTIIGELKYRCIYHVFIVLHFQLKMSYHLCSLTVGDGSDDIPFIISISSKALLSMLVRANESLIPVVFHMDSNI